VTAPDGADVVPAVVAGGGAEASPLPHMLGITVPETIGGEHIDEAEAIERATATAGLAVCAAAKGTRAESNKDIFLNAIFERMLFDYN